MKTQPNKEIVGAIGLGLLGTAITERLLEYGYRVAAWNRTRVKAEPLLAPGRGWRGYKRDGQGRRREGPRMTDNETGDFHSRHHATATE